MGQRFTATGPQQRNCPICFRIGTLTGERTDGAVLECTGGMAPGRSGDLSKGGCCAKFTFRDAEHSATGLATLERIDAEQWNHGARLADDRVCQGGCGRRGFVGVCPNCERAA